MRKMTTVLISLALLSSAPVYAINAKYRQQLEYSGCTQVSEMQGCDIHKSKAQNAKAGFVSGAEATQTSNSQSPYMGRWNASKESGATVARIRIDAKDQVWVNEKKVKAKKSDGALIFSAGKITYTIQGDSRIRNESMWMDSASGTKGAITPE